jgi:integrase
MRTPSLRTPSLRRHKPSSLGIVTLNGKDHYLGHWPADQKNPPEAVRVAYDRLISEWLATGRRCQPAPDDATAGSLSLNELLLAFIQHAEQHYRREDGTHTSEPRDFKAALKPLKELYGTLAVAEFGPLKLKAVRERMIAADLSRGVVNQRIRRIVRVFKWGVGEEIVPESVWRSLTTVRGLEKGRTSARETEPVKPVAAKIVEATLPFLLPPVRAMVELQRVTGMRPGEVCVLRACDLDTSGDVWLFRPHQHKTRHRGKERVVAIGPRGQEIIKPFLQLDTQAYLFSPRDSLAALRARQRLQRKTRVQPSQQDRRKRKPRKQPGERYKTMSYSHAVAKAVLALNKAQACDACKPLKPQERCEQCRAAAIPHWHPHQLRHAHATEVRRRFGLEAAQVALGHSEAKVTEVYAERDLTLAATVAKQIG